MLILNKVDIIIFDNRSEYRIFNYLNYRYKYICVKYKYFVNTNLY